MAAGSSPATTKHEALPITSPYYLHPSNHPGLAICPVTLKGDNYNEWTTTMRNAFIAKQKVGFIDGSLLEPASTTTEYEHWLPVNSMLVGWIMQSIDPSLRSSITSFSTAKELWDDLKQRFSMGMVPEFFRSAPRLLFAGNMGNRWPAIMAFSKSCGMSYLSLYVPVEMCSCNNCTCGMNSRLSKARDEERIHQFLMGLEGTVFGTLRSNIMAQEPLPALSRIYQLVIQEERLCTVTQEQASRTDGVAYAVRNPVKLSGSNASMGRKSLVCSHCGRSGHDDATCFKLHGFPDWFYEKKGSSKDPKSAARAPGRGKAKAVAHAAVGAAAAVVPSDAERTALGPAIANEQWSSMLKLF